MDKRVKTLLLSIWPRLMALPKRVYRRFIAALFAVIAALLCSQIRLAASQLPFAAAVLLSAALLCQSPVFACAGFFVGSIALGRPFDIPVLCAVLFAGIYHIFLLSGYKSKPRDHIILFALCQGVHLVFLPVYTFPIVAESLALVLAATGLGLLMPFALRYIRQPSLWRRHRRCPPQLAVKTETGAGESAQIILQTAEQICKTRLRILHAEKEENVVTVNLEDAPPFAASVAISQIPSEKDAVSGDAAGECRLPGGRVVYALSDGCGSGCAARVQSCACIENLFALYRKGLPLRDLYKALNHHLVAQGDAPQDMYATLDALEIDLHTGEAELVKFGSPPAYLLRGEQLSPLEGEAPPCGIVEDAAPSAWQLNLRRGDKLLFCSDGFCDALGDACDAMLRRHMRLPPQEMANALARAAQAAGNADDVTVMVVGFG
ncbi:MAG: SpoIIE family protein phosphatase [Clostridiales bacterium]|nr:SpoIIE family protein phosphatase [Clostridiales bacterium]